MPKYMNVSNHINRIAELKGTFRAHLVYPSFPEVGLATFMLPMGEFFLDICKTLTVVETL